MSDPASDTGCKEQGYRKLEIVQYKKILNPKISDETRKMLRNFDKVSKILFFKKIFVAGGDLRYFQALEEKGN